jgi:hypothetical protein
MGIRFDISLNGAGITGALEGDRCLDVGITTDIKI